MPWSPRVDGAGWGLDSDPRAIRLLTLGEETQTLNGGTITATGDRISITIPTGAATTSLSQTVCAVWPARGGRGQTISRVDGDFPLTLTQLMYERTAPSDLTQQCGWAVMILDSATLATANGFGAVIGVGSSTRHLRLMTVTAGALAYQIGASDAGIRVATSTAGWFGSSLPGRGSASAWDTPATTNRLSVAGLNTIPTFGSGPLYIAIAGIRLSTTTAAQTMGAQYGYTSPEALDITGAFGA